MYEHIKICIFLIIYFQNAISYKLYQLDSAEANKLIPKIRQLLLNQRYEEPEESLQIQKKYEPDYQSVQVSQAKNESPRLKPMGKSILVKRVIPHGYVTGQYEYDSKLNTVFKPLTRFHVKKPIEDHERSILKGLEADQKRKDRLGKDLIILVPKADNQQYLMNQIQKYMNQNVRQNDRNNNVKDKFITLDTIDNDSDMSLRMKSGEDNDPYAPGKLPSDMLQQSSSDETIENNGISSYPFWNYWTYSKNVLQDRCPGNLVKVGNMCISKLGHRRSAAPRNTRRSHHHNKDRHSIRASRKKHLYGRRK